MGTHQNTFSSITSIRSSEKELFIQPFYHWNNPKTRCSLHETYSCWICPKFFLWLIHSYQDYTLSALASHNIPHFFLLLIQDIPVLQYCGSISNFICEAPGARQVKQHTQADHIVKSPGTEYILYPNLQFIQLHHAALLNSLLWNN